jgi:hypothetical protein
MRKKRIWAALQWKREAKLEKKKKDLKIGHNTPVKWITKERT